ncbi:MAG TPA: PTS sugar transporter subunit IIC [Longimicrobiales bacterium]|nr:PTS sugar transporter subunit IIC [Longimicrobiales bacterium]
MIWLALAALGGVVALDASSFGQLMLSRPLVAGTLAGAIVGMPLEGALVGAMLEALSLSILPVGAARYPETGTAAVAAVGTLGLSGAAATAPALLLILVYGVAWQRAAGVTVIAGRYVNERLVRAGRRGALRMDRMIQHRHLESMLIDILRGAAVTVVALLIGVPLMRLAVPLWQAPGRLAAVVIAMSAAAVLAGTAPLFADSPRGRRFLAAGLLCGSALLLLR